MALWPLKQILKMISLTSLLLSFIGLSSTISFCLNTFKSTSSYRSYCHNSSFFNNDVVGRHLDLENTKEQSILFPSVKFSERFTKTNISFFDPF